MNIYIYGAGVIGERLLKKMEAYDVNAEGFIDTYKKGEIFGKSIFSLDEIEKNGIIILSVLNTNNILEIYQTLRSNKFSSIYWFYDFSEEADGSGEDAFLSVECLNLSNWGNLIMPHVELHISDKCNLNCKGCTHFSPLFDEIGADFEKKMEDIRQLKGLFSDIFRIDILGGEPLLNPELGKYIEELRKELPKSFIQIYTNGLLIPKLSDDILRLIHDYNIGISISEYYPTHQMIDAIIDKLKEYKIHYRIAEYDSKQLFNTPISIKPDSIYPKMCISDGCITISDGLVARCPTLMYISKFNEYFNQNLPTEGIYKIDDYKDGKKLLEDMRKNVPLCKHCIKKNMEWSVCGREKKMEDFAVSE